MASVAGRQIDTRFQNTSLLNKSAAQSSSLYQKCSSLRDKLLRIRGFTDHFPELMSSSDSTDPVTQIWDLFSMGTPLCYIFDQLPPEDGFKKLHVDSLSTPNYQANPERAKKRAIVLFAMQLRGENILQKVPECEMFTVSDLWNRHSTDGLVKVVNTVTAIVDYLPEDAFKFEVSLNPTTDSDTNDKNAPQNNIIREMLETERKYVQDLETMQRFSNALSQANIINQDTIHLLFPNLNQLVNFQRKFLIRLEFMSQLPLKVQRWGQQFIEYEEEFSVYEPYCVNYKNATELMLGNEHTLAALNHMINVRTELPALLLKPIQRVCQYPLFLDSLAKALSNQGYDHHYELARGSVAAKRVIDKINEAQRREENQEIVKNLKNRVQDWKGHRVENFGDLLLHDVFVVDKSYIERVYVTFLFSKILILCKVDHQQQKGSKKKMNTKEWQAVSSVMGSAPLLLKGRIFMRNVVSATHIPLRADINSGFYPLKITWNGDDGPESFAMKCTRQEQMKQWQDSMTRLIQSFKSTFGPSLSELPSDSSPLRRQLRHIGAPPPPLDSRYSTVSNSTLPLYSPHQQDGYDDEIVDGASRRGRDSDDEVLSEGDDDLEDYPPPSYPPSGRDTPIQDRALTRSRSLPSRFKYELKEKMGESSSTQGSQIPSRGRSNSLPAGASIPSDAASEASDNERTPPKTPQASNRSLPLIPEDLFTSPRPVNDNLAPVDLDPQLLRETEARPASKLKVHFRDDLFILRVPQEITHDELMEKIKRKCRLCGPLPDGPLKVKYKDEDGDLVLLTSTEDVQLALDQLIGPGKDQYLSFYVS